MMSLLEGTYLVGTYRNCNSVVYAVLVGALRCGRGDRLRWYSSKERARRRRRQRQRVSIATPCSMDLPAGI